MPGELIGALGGHARARPEDPWLFFTGRRGWQWSSFREVAARAEFWRTALAEGPGPVAEPPPERTVEGLAHSLARLASGGPLPADGAEVARQLPESGLLVAARRLAERLPARAERDVWVSGRSWRRAEERILLAWATLTAAAVVLEPWDEAAAGTCFWARPTVLSGSAAELAWLRGELLRLAGRFRPERALGRRLRRLRVVWVEGTPALPEEDAAFWRRLGAPVEPFPCAAE